MVIGRAGDRGQAKDRHAGRPGHIAASAQGHDLREGKGRQPVRSVPRLILCLDRVAVFEPRLNLFVGNRRPATAKNHRRPAAAGRTADGRDIVGARRPPADDVGTDLACDHEAGQCRRIGVVVDRKGYEGPIAGVVAAAADGLGALDERAVIGRRGAGVDARERVCADEVDPNGAVVPHVMIGAPRGMRRNGRTRRVVAQPEGARARVSRPVRARS